MNFEHHSGEVNVGFYRVNELVYFLKLHKAYRYLDILYYTSGDNLLKLSLR